MQVLLQPWLTGTRVVCKTTLSKTLKRGWDMKHTFCMLRVGYSNERRASQVRSEGPSKCPPFMSRAPHPTVASDQRDTKNTSISAGVK